ncbi:MAG: hypothetical protein V6Z86_05085 [Hyphomicrobiales bacterium]
MKIAATQMCKPNQSRLFGLRFAILMLVFLPFMTGCASNSAGDTYNASELNRESTIERGVIVAMRQVKISGGNDGIGSVAGAGIGGTLGSYLGNDKRTNIVGGIVGAVAGGLAGHAVEGAVDADKATEFLIEKTDGKEVSIVQKNADKLRVGDRVRIVHTGRVVRIVLDR